MTHTLTTDELRQIVETDHTQCGDAAAMARELLANREAQPVAWTTLFGDKRAVTVYVETAEVWAADERQVQSLFTAPPAPAVPEGFKLMPLEMTDDIGEAIAMEARCCGGIALSIYEAALAAVPGGGNG